MPKYLLFFFFLCFRLSLHNFEHLINFAETFTWKQFQFREPHTGTLTMRGYIVRISSFTKFAWACMTVFHVRQSSYRMLSSRAMIFTTWYPFDVSTSPLYEIVTFTQVGLHLYWIKQGTANTIWLLSEEVTENSSLLIYYKSTFRQGISV
jgi:hypothetical protein